MKFKWDFNIFFAALCGAIICGVLLLYSLPKCNCRGVGGSKCNCREGGGSKCNCRGGGSKCNCKKCNYNNK